ncbi:MAG TPA: hypothetical protein VE978_03630 [Chitinophagales bacterium]|nr:hypothetical protein [Chitinophagales bacterium]
MKKMFVFVSYVSLAVLILKAGYSNAQTIVFSDSTFKNAEISYKKSNVPSFVKRSIESACECKIKLANPNRKFNYSDTRWNPFLPERQLIFIVKLHDMYILNYIHGGLGTHVHCIILWTRGRKVEVVKSIWISQSIDTFEDLKASLLRNIYREVPPSYCAF